MAVVRRVCSIALRTLARSVVEEKKLGQHVIPNILSPSFRGVVTVRANEGNITCHFRFSVRPR